MIEVTPSDIGRRVVYSHPVLKHKGKGTVVSVSDDGRWIDVAYDPDGEVLTTGNSGLDWLGAKPGKPA